MFEGIMNFFKKTNKKEEKTSNSKEAAKERLHLVLMQDRVKVSADFLELMKQEIIEVIKKYIDVDENAMDVRLTNKENEDGTNGAPALYANIPIINIKNEIRKTEKKDEEINKNINELKEEPKEEKKEEKIEVKKEEKIEVKEQKNEIKKQTEKEKSEEKKVEIKSNEKIENKQKIDNIQPEKNNKKIKTKEKVKSR